jgi:hypothetical protein
MGESDTRASLLVEGSTGSCDVGGGASEVSTLTESLGGIRGTGNVGVTSVIRNSGSLTHGVDPLVGTVDGASVAGAYSTTVEHVLNREVNVDALTLSRNLDTITESRYGSVSPTGT